MSNSDPDPSSAEHSWRGIALEVYEEHMGDARVTQLQRLHDITAEQLTTFPARTIGILGVAGGNGLDLVDPSSAYAVYGYDINPDYLHACDTGYRATPTIWPQPCRPQDSSTSDAPSTPCPTARP